MRPGVTHAGETGGTLQYGYIVVDATSRNGFPATIRRIVYESVANTAIIVPNFCGTNASIISILDIDGDCVVEPLTDGLLLTRAMMGLTVAAVTNNANGRGRNPHVLGANTPLSQPAIRGELFAVGC